jgi:hypothetical protein
MSNQLRDIYSGNFTFHYIDDVFSLNVSRVGDFVEHIYSIELEIKDTTNTDRSAPYLDLHLKIDSEGQLRTKLYDKRDYFNFPIVYFSLYLDIDYEGQSIYDKRDDFHFPIIFFPK